MTENKSWAAFKGENEIFIGSLWFSLMITFVLGYYIYDISITNVKFL